MVVLVVAQSRSSLDVSGTQSIRTSRSLPTYSAVLPSFKVVEEKTLRLKGKTVQVRIKAFPPENYVAEVWSEVPNVFDASIDTWRTQLIRLAEDLVRKYNVLEEFKEEYTLYCVRGYKGDPKAFLDERRSIVRLIKSEPLALSDQEIEETIRDGSLQYAKDDLTIVDWDGAFIFDPKGDWQETIDLLEVANVHLLRLRVLDQQLDQRLESVSSILNGMKTNISGREVNKQMALLLRTRVRSIEDFSHSARDFQLIGDWYAAKLYTLISRKLHLDDWRISLRDELDNLNGLYHAAADHFGVSAQTRAARVEQLLWFVLLLGYFVIFFIDYRNALNG
jgi:hypothetical protein